MEKLNQLKVAILTENGFEQSELTSPKQAMEEKGIRVDVISPREGEVKAWDKDNWGITVKVDKLLSEARAEDYDGLFLPGGVMNPDKLRQNKDALEFVRRFHESGKPIGAICHGPQVLIDAEVVRGREMTSYPALRTDLVNAGANWVDREVVTDQGLVTSRSPADLEAFNSKFLEELGEGIHQERIV
ncbi:protease I [Anseongella ginsenosidimutans]|uniref:Protease I n=1 Tax=Anseongella ginsenosidimutans TaxID=496056 RepID=A0A4R3KPI6_9SPHI|nr:type 1 glutamine amidotransferase domain-containing protein [Anseongella ginsenosidimutans]QEC53670.1 type 1 glutamine amidotransferase [Anseongella ginsenosidimutans]TCS86080.1 protease I [Anseongella ginsenosidimutans]